MNRRALIVDDEPEARRRLAGLLAAHSGRVGLVGEAADGLAAVDSIQKLKPDIVFLDIEMPGLDGFGVLDSLPQDEWPLVIFTTADDQYAIRAFEVHALDYLLKPVTGKRLADCLSRLDAIKPGAHRSRLEKVRRENRTIERLMARSGSKLVVVNMKDVIAFETQDDLAFARTPQGRSALNVTLKELEERLDANVFCRVHKQTIVRLSCVRELHHDSLKLSDGSEVEIGRSYAREFAANFANYAN